MQSLGFGFPLVESSRDANSGGGRMSEFKANRHELRARSVVMVMIIFHSSEFDWFPWRNSFTEHFCHDEDENGSAKTSSEKEIQEGVTSGGKHGLYYQRNHRQ